MWIRYYLLANNSNVNIKNKKNRKDFLMKYRKVIIMKFTANYCSNFQDFLPKNYRKLYVNIREIFNNAKRC